MPTPSQIKSLSIKRCQEQVVDACAGEAAGCCGVVMCGICVKVYDEYGNLIDGNLAPYDDGSYRTTVNGHSFLGVWSRDYYSDECVFTVTIDGEQVFEYTCYDSPCRAVSGVAVVPEGTVEWTVSKPIPIARRLVNGCLHEFCEGCGCAPENVCVKITGEECSVANVFPFSGTKNDCGEATTVEYDFSLTCGEEAFEGTVSLVRNAYNECEVILSVAGEADALINTGCTISGSTSVSRYDGSYTISVTEAPCGCTPEVNALCCPDPIPTTLYLSGGLIPSGTTVPLACTNCPPETASNYVERTFTGSFVTDWLTNHELGSGGEIITVFTGRLIVYAEYSCGSGFRLSLAADVHETTDPVVLPVGQPQSSDVSVVYEFCDPIFNAYTGIYQLFVGIAAGDAINYDQRMDWWVTE